MLHMTINFILKLYKKLRINTKLKKKRNRDQFTISNTKFHIGCPAVLTRKKNLQSKHWRL